MRLKLLIGTVLLSVTACQAPVAAPVTGPVAPAFGPITRDQVLALRRAPREALGSRQAAQIIAAWEAPAIHRAGNWEFVVGGGFPPGSSDTAPESTQVLQALSFTAYDPLLASRWATDAQEQPDAVPGAPRVFVSAALKGALTVDEKAGVALAVTWEAAPTAAEVPVSEAMARATFEKAYADAKALGSEDATGLDHFTGVPFTNVDRFPAGCLNIVARAGETLTSEREPVLEFQAPQLERRLGKRVWRITESYPAACLVGPTLETIYDKKTTKGFLRVHGAGGYVDAETGALIRIRRAYNVHGVLGM